MREVNERPICHRAEDLVTYLYGEASEMDSRDFREHLELCDSCRNEFAMFNKVHESIALWRSEALGVSFNPAAATVTPVNSSDAIVPPHPKRRLSALAALREFFTVSPLWLRGATAFAAVLLCVLGILMFTRLPRKPIEIAQSGGDKKVYTSKELAAEVTKAVNEKVRELTANNQARSTAVATDSSDKTTRRPTTVQLAINRQLKNQRTRDLTRQEREQLAADLRLTSSLEEEDLLAFPEEHPNQ